MKIKISILAVVLVSSVTIGLVAQQQNRNQRSAAAGDPAITSKLEEIVLIREKRFRSFELQLEAGRAPVDGLAEIELAEARVELAREKGRREALLQELRNLVAAHERRLGRMQSLQTVGRDAGGMDQARIALLEAQIRLLRAE